MRIRGLARRAYRPEIVYYPFIAEPEILNDEPFNLSKGSHSWEQQLKLLAELNGIEIHTPDRARFKNVIGVIFFDNMFYHNLLSLKKLHSMNLLEKTVYIDFEPPTGHAKKHEQDSLRLLSKLFKAVITYDDDLANRGNFIKGNVANFYADLAEKKDFSKKNFAVMVTNNTTPSMIIRSLNYWNNTDYYNVRNISYHKKAIYHKRLEVASYFLNNHKSELDIYGSGFPDDYKEMCRGYLNRSEKIDKMSYYKFAFAFDSYTNQNGYISEKIFDAFFARTVPVYLGADNVSKYIPRECFIDLRDFSSYDQLYNYLAKMSRKEYDKRILAIDAFLESDKFNDFFSSKAIAQKLFDTILSDSKYKYDSIHAKKILDDLDLEKKILSGEEAVTLQIDKQFIDKKWCFVICVKLARKSKRPLKIFALANDKKTRIKTYIDNHPQRQGNTYMIIPYEFVLHERQTQYFIDLGRGSKVNLSFSEHIQEIINMTHYDDNVVFYADKNTIGCRDISAE